MAQKKKICPKCGTRYEGKVHQFTTMCPLRHCPKCGYKYTETSEDDIARVIAIFVIGLLLVPLGIAGIIELTTLIVPPQFPAWIAIVEGAVIVAFWIWLLSLRRCINCKRYFSAFFTKSDIPLKEIEEEGEIEEGKEWEPI
jgi:uncharacterized protein (DUF983 family)